ncbi:hypothetical protein QOZ80_7AG0556490 [Eleusine coracana subsp. coracana]|nr:hypothetical protein QOZ80_7AG0556490 [Eleusine coracana subsp. coracana]
MEPGAATAATSSAPSWRGMVRRHSQAWEERERAHRRVEELEADVARLRAEKRAAERAAAALRAHLEAEQGAAETAATEAMAMIARLQREKSAAMIEAREFRRVAEVRTARDRELQDQIAEAYALAASYQAILRAHGIDDPDVDDDGKAKGVVINKEAAPSPSLPHPAATDEFQDKHPVDVSWVAGKTKTVAGDLRARVEALEADSVAVRREVAALRAERAQAVLTRRRDDAAGKQQRFPVLGIFKWFFSTVSWGTKLSASAARKLPNIICSSPTTYLLLGLLPLLERSKGTLKIRSKTSSQPVHSHGQEYSTLCYFFQ